MSNAENKLEVAQLTTVLHVAKHLQHHEALLLPNVSTYFLDLYCGAGEWSNEVSVELEVSDGTANFTHKWLLHLLIVYLQPYMQYICVVRKIGTLIYPSGPHKRLVSQSPGSSPHQLGKKGPKSRTPVSPLVKFTRPHSEKQMSQFLEDLSVEQFKESEREAAENDSISVQMFIYLTHKSTFTSNDNTLKEMNEFLYLMQGSESPRVSHIHYMELLNENADSQETVLHISDYLLSELHSQYQDGWVLLVGDGKTYEHLRNIKNLYGEDLEKLLIFPGDWHVLKNFQPLLMKMYYGAGLKEMAQASGFQGETLTSLEKCSNFKRTHQFF